jgi:hypothetical protein
MSIFSGLGRGM